MALDYQIQLFHFMVEWGGNQVRFSDVSGLVVDEFPEEFRELVEQEYLFPRPLQQSTRGNITLRRGTYWINNDFSRWLNTIRIRKLDRRDLLITLANKQRIPMLTWRAKRACPVRVNGQRVTACGHKIAMESIELIHEGIELLYQN